MSEHINNRRFLEGKIKYDLDQTLGDHIKGAVVMGSSALELMSFEEVNRTDLDVSVSSEAFEALRHDPEWNEVAFANGKKHLSKDGLDVCHGINHNGSAIPHSELVRRSWQTENELSVVALPYIYAHMQQRGFEKDERRTELVRKRLTDPTATPIPAAVWQYERGQVDKLFTDELRQDPNWKIYANLCAYALFGSATLYADPELGRANQMIGDLERKDFGTVSTYHNAAGLIESMESLSSHYQTIGLPVKEYLQGLTEEGWADYVYGHGRGVDETKSAEMLRATARHFDLDTDEMNDLGEGIIGTKFTEKTKKQLGIAHPSLRVQGVVGEDLQTLSETDSVTRTYDLNVEDTTAARAGDRLLGRALTDHGVRIHSTEQGLAFIDTHPNLRPHDALDGPSVQEDIVRRLTGNANFHDPTHPFGHKYPASWTRENKSIRARNAAELRRHVKALEQGMTFTEGYERAKQHTQDLEGTL